MPLTKIHCLCQSCNIEFLAIPSAKRKFCSNKCYNKSKLGKKTWNSGLKNWRTKEHTKKLRKAIILRNKSHPLATEQASINGSKATRQLLLFTAQSHKAMVRKSALYRNWRTAVFERDNHTCQQCFIRGSYLQAHHMKSYAEFPSDRFKVENGITLCKTCHSIVHSLKKGRGY